MTVQRWATQERRKVLSTSGQRCGKLVNEVDIWETNIRYSLAWLGPYISKSITYSRASFIDIVEKNSSLALCNWWWVKEFRNILSLLDQWLTYRHPTMICGTVVKLTAFQTYSIDAVAFHKVAECPKGRRHTCAESKNDDDDVWEVSERMSVVEFHPKFRLKLGPNARGWAWHLSETQSEATDFQRLDIGQELWLTSMQTIGCEDFGRSKSCVPLSQAHGHWRAG